MNGDRGKYGLGPKPELDIEKAEELCGLEEGTSYSLLPGLVFRQERFLEYQEPKLGPS
jgi:hypothetical protein